MVHIGGNIVIWLEANPMAKECENCPEKDCYNCETAGKRWILSREDELRINRKLLIRKIEHIKRKIAEIDAELERLCNL